MMPRRGFPLQSTKAWTVLLFLGILGGGCPKVGAQVTKPTLQRSAAALETNTEVIKRLATVEDHVKERQWEQAILILQHVAADHGEALMAVSPRRYLNVTTYCNSVLANLPPAGLAVYREKHDAQARQWLEQGLASRNPALLEKIVQKAFVSRSGDEALFWLGEWAWDRGNFAAARDYWRKLLKLPNPPDAGQPQSVLRYPDSSRSQAEVISRIVLCHLMEGNQTLARRWLAYLQKQYPEARGKLAGQEGVLVEILTEVLQKSQDWSFPPTQGETPTFAGNPQRDFRYPKPTEVGGVQWEIPLPEHAHDPASPRGGPQERSLSYFPAIVDNTIFFCDPDRIYALDLLTGRAKWPFAGEGVITKRSDLNLAAIYQSPVSTSTRERYRLGVARFTLTIHENRLYARMGSPITGQVSSTGSSNGHLVCLDLTKEGKLVWTCEPEAVLAGTKLDAKRQWAFEGTPIVEGGRVFVGLRQSHPQTEAVVACLDAETGKPQWARRVASALSHVAEQQNFISHHLITLGENMVFYMPEFGVITALDAWDGRQLWAVTYSSFLPKDSRILAEPRKQGLTPCVFHQGVIYAAPTDSESVLAISAKTGVILWEREIPFSQDQIRHVLGVVDNQLVLTGNHVWILSATTGNLEYPKQPTPGRQPEFDGYGRGLVAGDKIFWPTRSTIEIRNLAGQRTKQPEPYPGGNLAIAGDLLLVAEPTRLVAYSNFAKVKDTQQKLLSENPKAALPHWRLGRVAEASGDLRQALALYEQALALATPQDVVQGKTLTKIARENRFQILLRLGQKALADDNRETAVAHFQHAAKTAFDRSTQAEALHLLGNALILAKRFEEAVETFQSILDDSALAKLPAKPDGERMLGEFAKSQIGTLIQKHGRAVYAPFDRLASQKIQDQLRQQDLEGVEDLLRRFPNAKVSSETRHQLARLKRDQGKWWEGIANWQQLLEEPLEPRTQQLVLLELARTLEQHGYFQPAGDYWRQLEREFPSSQISRGGTAVSAAVFVPRHLQSEDYRKLNQPAPALPLTRRWEQELPPEAHGVLPEGTSPGPALACVLVDNRELACLNQTDGQMRWRKQLNNRVIWAAYGRTHLVLGTTKSLLAVMLETGQTLWQLPLEDSAEAADSSPGFQLIENQILVVLRGKVSGFHANTGREIWTRNPAGPLSDTWYADEKFVVLQTENPLKVLVLQTKTGRQLSEHRLQSPWTSPPVPLPHSTDQPAGSLPNPAGFVVSMVNRRIRAFSAFDALADPAWRYDDATSYANATPRFWSRGDHLLLLMDGDTLLKLNPKTGDKLWVSHLAQSPLPNPAEAIVLEEEFLYAAEGNTLHCLRLSDGQTIWKQPLPRSEAWAMQKQGRFLMTIPRESATARSVVIFDAQTGGRSQELKVEPHVIAWTFHSQTPVIVTQQKLMGWGPVGFFGTAN